MDEHLRDLMEDLEQYIRDNWVASDDEEPSQKEVDDSLNKQDRNTGISKSGSVFSGQPKPFSLEELIGDVGKTFHEVLFEKIAESGMTDVEVYKRANMDRKLFSKIRNNPAYHPGKDTVLALAIALRMNLEQTQDLLSRAEYAFSPSSKSDVIVRYFIEREIYDIHLINIALDEHGQAILE